jgi:hypothetical protein
MPRNPSTGVFTRVSNSFSDPVLGEIIDPTAADAFFDDQDTEGFNVLPTQLLDGDLDIVNFDGGTGADNTTFWRGDGTWAPAGGGDVTAASNFGADNRLIRSDGTTKGVQASGVTVDDSNNVSPSTTDSGALGTTSLMWSDLFLASGAVVNWNNGDVTLTHSANNLTFAGFANSGSLGLGYSSTIFGRFDQTVEGVDTVTTRALMAVANVTSGSGGFAIGAHGIAQDGGTWTTAGNYGIQGVLAEGVGTIAAQRVWGANIYAKQTTAAGADICGLEVNVDVRDVQATNRYGIQIVVPSAGTLDGATIDSALRVTNKVGGAPWTVGIDMTNAGGAQPIKTGGYLWRVSGGWTCAIGVDFTGVTITGNAFASNAFSVTGAGALTAASLTTAGAVSGATVAGNMVATQANMETGTATNLLVSPGRQQYHPAHPKFWINFDGTGTPAARAGYNNGAITDHGVGDYSIAVSTAFSNTNGAILMSTGFTADGATNVQWGSTSSINIRTRSSATGAFDNALVCVAAYGDQ